MNPSPSLGLLNACRHCGLATSNVSGYCCNACRLLDETDWIDRPRIEPPPAKFAAFALPEIQARYDLAKTGGEHRYRVALEGLQCSSCVHLIENLPRYMEGVKDARVDFAKALVHVRTAADVTLPQVLAFLEEMGYGATPLLRDERGDEQRAAEDRAILKRLGVTGAASGNIILFTVPIYGGLTGSLASIFNWISFALFLTIVLYPAVPLYKSAWAAIKLRHLNVDAPLVIALWAGFLASTFNLIRGEGGLYFDSSAGFIFLILVSRWFLRVSQRRWADAPLAARPWLRETLRVSEGGGSVRDVPAAFLKPGMEFELAGGQILPVDAELLSARAVFDTSWMTGEAFPRILQKSMPLSAGFRNLQESALCRARTGIQESELAESLSNIERESAEQSPRINSFDRAARALLLTVFALAALILFAGPQFGWAWNDAFERALSLLIVACPCALAFGGPLAYGMAMRRAARFGVLVRGPDVLDRVNECRHIVFDKTGTLTTGSLELVAQSPKVFPGWIRDLILSLEKKSNHPVAEGFRRAWSEDAHGEIPLQDVHEVPGEKIFGIFNRRLYCLSAGKPMREGLTVRLLQDEKEIAQFVFADRLRNETRDLLLALTAADFRIEVMSGDQDPRVQALLTELDVPGLTGRGDRRPADKAARVRELGDAMMIGDGANDGEALAAAHVGVAVNGSLERGLHLGRVYFLKPGLRPVLELIRAARAARRLVRRNLFFALAYNVAAGTAAVAGWIHPLAAAALMPLSSILILLSTWEASR